LVKKLPQKKGQEIAKEIARGFLYGERNPTLGKVNAHLIPNKWSKNNPKTLMTSDLQT
jgi:hypothetical protein